MGIRMNTGSCRASPEDEYGAEILYAGWNPDIALLAYQQQLACGARANRPALQLHEAGELHLPYGQQPFAK